MNYHCSKCEGKNRLVVWSRDRGYLCAVCAGQAADEPYPRGAQVFATETPREYGERVGDGFAGAFTRRQVKSSLTDIIAPSNPLATLRERLEAKAREEVESAPRPEPRRGYEGWRAPNDPRRW